MKINNIQKKFILSAIHLSTAVYDFENTTDEEFKELYWITPKKLDIELEKLKTILLK